MASFDEVKLEGIVRDFFATYNPNTGANKDADSLPTIVVYEEGNSTALTVTSSVTNVTTGQYRWQITVAATDGFEAGKYYSVWITATVTGTDTVTQSTPVMSFKATTSVVDDVMATLNLVSVATNAGDLASKTADAGSVTTGTVISGTYASTFSDDNVYWITAPVTPAVGGYGLRQSLRFDLPLNRIPTQLQLRAYWTGSSQVVNVFALNNRTGLYDQLTNTGTNLASRTTELLYAIPIPRDYVDATGGINNIITFELRTASITTTFRLRIDRALVYHISEEAPFTMTAPTVNDIWTAPTRTLTDGGSEPSVPPTVEEIRIEMDANSTQLTAIDGKLPAALVDGRIDANASAVAGSTTAAENLELSAEAICTGTVDAGASTTSIPTSAFSPAVSAVIANQLVGRIVIFRRDTTTVALRMQATDIKGSSASATPTLTVTALTVAPAAADVFIIV